MSHGQRNVTGVRMKLGAKRNQWVLVLRCGHKHAVTAWTRPTRAHHYCTTCAELRRERHAITRQILAEWGAYAR